MKPRPRRANTRRRDIAIQITNIMLTATALLLILAILVDRQ
jgi:hypothetical protein